MMGEVILIIANSVMREYTEGLLNSERALAIQASKLTSLGEVAGGIRRHQVFQVQQVGAQRARLWSFDEMFPRHASHRARDITWREIAHEMARDRLRVGADGKLKILPELL